jgi:hypothetical protein
MIATVSRSSRKRGESPFPRQTGNGGHGPIVDLEADYYWTVGPWDAFQFEAAAPQPTVGQLTDDVRSMHDMLVDHADAPIAAWHELTHLIGILNRLAGLNEPAGNP